VCRINARIHATKPDTYIASFYFIFTGPVAQPGLWPPRSRGLLFTHNDAPQSVGLLWTRNQLVAETSNNNTQHTQQTNIHVSGGNQTHDQSRRAALDLRLRPRGLWDRQLHQHSSPNKRAYGSKVFKISVKIKRELVLDLAA
jgi:hypothetical protein